MSSGRRVIQINNLERAISPDINRMQAFAAKDTAEAFRQLYDVVTDNDDPGLVTVPTGTTGGNPGAEIFGGLMVRPQVASANILIDAGVIYIMDPDAGADDSDYKYVRDPGVTIPGSLFITTNVSGSIRIDLIECRINPTPLIVTDSRDIYDPITNLFTPNVVTKETAFVLQYRVRAGSPAGGIPALEADWVVLAVASVPTGTTTCDTVTFWDVRPLITDRAYPGNVGNATVPVLEQSDVRSQRISAVSVLLNGYWRAILNGRRIGGEFRRGSPGTDAANIDVANIANQGAAITEPLTGHVYLYACTPAGLPRWARYTDAPTARVPRTTKGMLVASYTKPGYTGLPSAAIPVPASTGLLGTTSSAVCVTVIPETSSGDQFNSYLGTNKMVSGVNMLRPADAALAGISYVFSVSDSEWPANAKAIYVQFRWGALIALTSIAEAIISVEVHDSVSYRSFEDIIRDSFSNFTAGDLPFLRVTPVVRLPLPVLHPAAAVSPRLVRIIVSMSTLSGAAPILDLFARMIVTGYEL